MAKLSGEEMQEKIDEFCFECEFYDEYDGCLKSARAIYIPDEEWVECDDYRHRKDAEDEYWERYAYEENFGKVE